MTISEAIGLAVMILGGVFGAGAWMTTVNAKLSRMTEKMDDIAKSLLDANSVVHRRIDELKDASSRREQRHSDAIHRLGERMTRAEVKIFPDDSSHHAAPSAGG